MGSADLYAPPRVVTDLTQCLFYQTMDLPEFGTCAGLFDLRAGVDDYLGRVLLQGKRVLEIGTANGFLCFEMERRGAEVVAFDLSPDHEWDFVPFATADLDPMRREYRTNLDKVKNAYWLAHRLYGSRARAVYGYVYDVPAAIGPVDVVTFGCVLLHLRDPFLALQKALALATDTVVVTELLGGWARAASKLWSPAVGRRAASWSTGILRGLASLQGSELRFLPDARRTEPRETWWSLSPEAVRRCLAVLGFEQTTVTFHFQTYEGRPTPLFTVVGKRTAPAR